LRTAIEIAAALGLPPSGGLTRAMAGVVAWLGAMVLVLAGVAKLFRPHTAREFLTALHLPSAPVVVRAMAGVEIAAGGAELGTRFIGALVAVIALYAAFVVVLVAHRWRTGARVITCGCFGSDLGIPLLPHVFLLVILALGTALDAASARASFSSVLTSSSPLLGAFLVTLFIVMVCLLVALLSLGGTRPTQMRAQRGFHLV
jgi:hypothetical protein